MSFTCGMLGGSRRRSWRRSQPASSWSNVSSRIRFPAVTPIRELATSIAQTLSCLNYGLYTVPPIRGQAAAATDPARTRCDTRDAPLFRLPFPAKYGLALLRDRLRAFVIGGIRDCVTLVI